MDKEFYKNISWMGLATISKVLMQLVFMGIMARFVSPEEYGLFAISLAVISFGQILSDAGLGAAIIQKESLKKEDISTAHFSSLILGLLCFISLYCFSDYISSVYEYEQILADVLKALSFIFIIKSVAVVAEALLCKSMEFKYIAQRDVVSFILSYILIGLPLAYNSFGIWALVFTMLSQEVIKSVLVIRKSKTKTCYKNFSYVSLKNLLHYTSGVTVSGFFNKVATNIDSILIGKFLGSQVLGYYSRAYQLMAYPANMFGVVVSKVFFPTLSKIQNNRAELAESHYTVLSQLALILLPASLSLYFFSEDIVFILLGSNWGESVPIFEVLSFGIYFRVAYKINGVIARATGHVYWLAIAQFIYALAISLSCMYGYEYGVKFVAILIVSSLGLQFAIKSFIGMSISGLRLISFCQAHVPALICMSINYLLLSFLLDQVDNIIIRVMTGITIYIFSMFLTLGLFSKRTEFQAIVNILARVKKNERRY